MTQKPSVVLFVQGAVALRCLHPQTLPSEIRSLVGSAKSIYQSWGFDERLKGEEAATH